MMPRRDAMASTLTLRALMTADARASDASDLCRQGTAMRCAAAFCRCRFDAPPVLCRALRLLAMFDVAR